MSILHRRFDSARQLEKSTENGKLVAKGNKLCYISVVVTREVIKKIDISDDSYCLVAQLGRAVGCSMDALWGNL